VYFVEHLNLVVTVPDPRPFIAHYEGKSIQIVIFYSKKKSN
jgi:hypothetical protein